MNNGGYAWIWILIGIGAISLGMYALLTPEPSTVSYLIYGVSSVLLCGSLYVQAKHDLYAFAQVTLVFFLGAALISGATVYNAQDSVTFSLVILIFHYSDLFLASFSSHGRS